MQHLHIIGICGTFMGSLAQLAKSLGFRVTGSDQHVYPPMSTQLEAAGITLLEGFEPAHLDDEPDLVIVGNVVARGNALMEAVMARGLPYVSGPQWIAENVLTGRWVLAVSGTHGKTTTSSMLAWILEFAGCNPGYLIGGVPGNFSTSAALGQQDVASSNPGFFVIEADEYDSAFFDKRSKFVHYRPRTLVINNLEYDHADIFPDLRAIQTQFHHLLRTVPNNGRVIYPPEEAIDEVMAMGVWSSTQTLGGDWRIGNSSRDGSRFYVLFEGAEFGPVEWNMTGQHNQHNALAAVAAAYHAGVDPQISVRALCDFKNPKRRMELLADLAGIKIYDDFAHHPTAIKTTLAGLRARAPQAPITALIEPRSNTMKQGVHKQQLKAACEDADRVFWLESPGQPWTLAEVPDVGQTQHHIAPDVATIIEGVIHGLQPGEQIVIMSNGAFGGIHGQLVAAVEQVNG